MQKLDGIGLVFFNGCIPAVLAYSFTDIADELGKSVGEFIQNLYGWWDGFTEADFRFTFKYSEINTNRVYINCASCGPTCNVIFRKNEIVVA